MIFQISGPFCALRIFYALYRVSGTPDFAALILTYSRLMKVRITFFDEIIVAFFSHLMALLRRDVHQLSIVLLIQKDQEFLYI